MEKILLEECQIKIFEIQNYENKDIRKFVRELKDLKSDAWSDCGDETWVNFAGTYQMKFLAIYEILMSKKLQRNKEDLKMLGKCIQDFGKEIENYEETLKKYENSEKQNKENEDDIAKKFAKALFDDIFGEDFK